MHSQIYQMRKFLFSPLNGHTNYVKVIKDGGCWSYIGMSGGEQEISLVGNLGGTHCWDQVPKIRVCKFRWCGFVGMGRQLQTLDLVFIITGGGCWFERTIVHEFIHAFGFHHEQVRPDRDNYVEIIYENIPENLVSNFNLFTGSLTYGVQYDGFSVMHYGSRAFTTDSFGNGNTIESKVLFELMHKNAKFA